MHQYLTSIGFSEFHTSKKIKTIINDVLQNPSRTKCIPISEDELCFSYEKEYGDCFGVCVIKVGEGEGDSEIQTYFPYVRGYNYLFNETFDVDHCYNHEGYYGFCDDNNLGIPMIFYLNNPVEYRKLKETHKGDVELNCVTLSGLATDGVVLLPIETDESKKKYENLRNEKRNDMIDAAKSGDIDAMESLTLEDMTTYTKVNQRSKREDLFTIVSSYFMPFTVECDKYSVLAEITEVIQMKNKVTSEELYYISLDCNSIEFEVLINKKNLLGIPEKGRRLKCNIWLQGQMDYL